MAPTNPDQLAVERTILGEAKRIAVVGASDDPSRPSYGVVATLLDAGYDVIPVNPNRPRVHGMDTYPSLAEVRGPIDLVDVFRRPEYTPDVARQAVAVGAKALWLQLGIRSDEARAIADDADLPYVEDACLAVELRRFAGEMPLPPP